MDRTDLTLDVTHPGQDINLRVTIDGQELWQSRGPTSGTVQIAIDGDEGPHELMIELSGKQPHHTKLSADGSIETDTVITIHNLAFDGIDLGHIFFSRATYCHDFNGTGAPTEEKFYGTMGCNGTVRLEFTMPIYLWLLENM